VVWTSLKEERDGAISVVTLCRPEQLNAFDDVLHREFTSVMAQLPHSPDVRAVVLGSTGRVFSAGGSFSLMREAHADARTRRAITTAAERLLTTLWSVPQPVVVALHGAAIGLGATIALSCDAIVAAEEASIADPHVCMGLVAGDGGCVVWPAVAGSLVAKRHLLTGDPIDARTAASLGLVTDVVASGQEALPAAVDLARRLADLPPLAVQLTKRVLNRSLLQRAGEVLELSLAYEESTLGSSDLLEAIAAFRERRAGTYSGT